MFYKSIHLSTNERQFHSLHRKNQAFSMNKGAEPKKILKKNNSSTSKQTAVEIDGKKENNNSSAIHR